MSCILSPHFKSCSFRYERFDSNIKMEEPQQSWGDEYNGSDCDTNPFEVEVGDATFEFSFELYRKREGE